MGVEGGAVREVAGKACTAEGAGVVRVFEELRQIPDVRALEQTGGPSRVVEAGRLAGSRASSTGQRP